MMIRAIAAFLAACLGMLGVPAYSEVPATQTECALPAPTVEGAFSLIKRAGLGDYQKQVPVAFWTLPIESGDQVRLDFKKSLHSFGTEYRFLNQCQQLAGEVFYRPWNNVEMNPWTKDHNLKMVFIMAVVPGKDVLFFLVYDYLVSNASGDDEVPVGLWRNDQVVPLSDAPPS